MPWRCPACQEQILHSPLEEQPRLGAVYRCPLLLSARLPKRGTSYGFTVE
jgi:hypothetical protein